MKLATLVAAAAFALVGASSAFAGNSLEFYQGVGGNGSNSAKFNQQGAGKNKATGIQEIGGNGTNSIRGNQESGAGKNKGSFSQTVFGNGKNKLHVNQK